MPRLQTELTELGVAFGILSVQPFDLNQQQVIELFNNTLDFQKYMALMNVVKSDKNSGNLFNDFYKIGQSLRHSLNKQINKISWSGPQNNQLPAQCQKIFSSTNFVWP